MLAALVTTYPIFSSVFSIAACSAHPEDSALAQRQENLTIHIERHVLLPTDDTSNIKNYVKSSWPSELPNCTQNGIEIMRRLGLQSDTGLTAEEQDHVDTAMHQNSCFEYNAHFTDGEPISPEIVYCTLANSLDFLGNKWGYLPTEQRSRFFPPNYYGLEIQFGRWMSQATTLDMLAWLLDSTAFWMRESKNFRELKGHITNNGKAYGIIYVTLGDPRPPSSSSPSLTLSNITLTNSSDFTDNESTPDAHTLRTRGSSLHTYRTDIRTRFLPRLYRLGPLNCQNDIMTSLLYLGRQAVTAGRVPSLGSLTYPDHKHDGVAGAGSAGK